MNRSSSCLLLIFLWLCQGLGFTQIQFECDTLVYESRTGGDFDSVDVANSLTSTTLDGGVQIHNFYSQSVLGVGRLLTAYVHDQASPSFNDRPKFSGIPVLGFAYSFGAQGSQFIRSRYVQAFNYRTLLNVTYERNSATGYIRNASWEHHVLKANFLNYSKRHAIRLDAVYGFQKNEFSGGVTTDTLIEDFGLAFTPVNKAAASDRSQQVDLCLSTELNFLDSIRRFGLLSKHRYQLSRREYLEADTLYGIYNNVFIDSFSTRDQYNLPGIENALGIFNSNRRFYISGGVSHRYLNYQNLGTFQDTTEIGIFSDLSFRTKRLNLRNSFRLNLIGAYGGIHNETYASYTTRKFQLKAMFNYSDLAPDMQKRKYFSNNFDYQLVNVQRQQFINGKVDLTYRLSDSVFRIRGASEIGIFQSPYIWDDSMWNNNLYSSINLMSFDLGADLSIRNFRFDNSIRMNISTDNLLPTCVFSGRWMFRTAIFKAKRLQFMAGVEPYFNTGFKQRIFLPVMNVFSWDQGTSMTSALLNLHAFTGMKIDEFRFYVRFENIAYFWNNKLQADVIAYPLAAPRLRIGIVWDFFN